MLSRKSKGYIWEIKVKEKLQSLGFIVERLGGTTTELPDLVAHKDDSFLIIGVECKSVSGTYGIVPAEQLQRCIDEGKKWGLYKNRMVILAFQFCKYELKSSKEYREKREYLKVWNFNYAVKNISCNYDGICRCDGDVIKLEEFNVI